MANPDIKESKGIENPKVDIVALDPTYRRNVVTKWPIYDRDTNPEVIRAKFFHGKIGVSNPDPPKAG